MFLQQRNIPVLKMQAMRYAVVFNLDMSGSMSGSKWKKLSEAVEALVKGLGEGDIVAGIVFNNKVEMMSNKGV